MQKSSMTLKNHREMVDIYFTHNDCVKCRWPDGERRVVKYSRFLAVELRKLHPIQSYPCDANGNPSWEIDWLPGTNGYKLDPGRGEMLHHLLDYVEKM